MDAIDGIVSVDLYRKKATAWRWDVFPFIPLYVVVGALYFNGRELEATLGGILVGSLNLLSFFLSIWSLSWRGRSLYSKVCW